MERSNEPDAPSLVTKTLKRFDDLLSREVLYYQETVSEKVEGEFPLQFRLVRAFERKPWPGHEKVKPASKPDPFGHPEPDFVVTTLPGYVLQLNKFCALRPQLLLHPCRYQSQKDRLTEDDFDVLCKVLRDLGDNYMAFYNCGPEAGSSQPYKHIQIVQKPERRDFVMWPDRPIMAHKLRESAQHEVLEPLHELRVPYVARVGSIVGNPFVLYRKSLESLEEELHHDVVAHNVVITRDWLAVTPRRASGKDAFPGVNSMGMMGMIWTVSQSERDAWNGLGMAQYLASMGYPSRIAEGK